LDDRKFDELAKALAAAASRRSVIKSLTGGALGGVLALIGRDRVRADENNQFSSNDQQGNNNGDDDDDDDDSCRAVGKSCRNPRDCCTRQCSGNVCICTADDQCPKPKGRDRQCKAANCRTDGTCEIVVNVDTACDDGNRCTINDICDINGNCSGTPIPGCCRSNDECKDDNPCTKDFCDRETRQCVHKEIPGCCRTDADCDDDNPCTRDACRDGKCVHRKIRGCCQSNAECVDGSCTCGGNSEAGHCQAPFYQGFESDTSGWNGVTRVASGSHGITSKAGAFHGEVGQGSFAAFTRWGGYSNQFPPGGYTTSLDIYLDTTGNYANDTRFDWISAVNKPDCDQRRDFAFVAGYYNDTDATGTGPRFVINAQFNSGRGSSFPKDTGKTPITIVAPGWYTFRHEFRGVPGGPLVVEMTILNSLGVPVMSWTLSDPSDIIGVTVGGNGYGGVTSEFPFLAIDESKRTEP
jgi:hypothetical protein